MRGEPHKNRIIFWWAGPLWWYRLPPLGEYSRTPSVSVYQLALLWEAVFGFSEFFFGRLFQHICTFHDGWFTSTPAHTTLSVQQFLTKNGMTPMPHPPYSPNVAPSDFFCFPGWKKSSKRNVLLTWETWNKKRQKHWKASKSTSSKTVLSSGKNISIGVRHRMESTLKVTEV